MTFPTVVKVSFLRRTAASVLRASPAQSTRVGLELSSTHLPPSRVSQVSHLQREEALQSVEVFRGVQCVEVKVAWYWHPEGLLIQGAGQLVGKG